MKRISAEIDRNGSAVVIRVDSKLGTPKPIFTFYFNCADESWAELLRDYLEKNFRHTIHKIRKESYEDGWSDAKKKKAKRGWHSSCLE